MLDGGDLERRYRRNPIPNPECFTPRKTQLSPALRSSLAEALQGAGDLRDISPDDWIQEKVIHAILAVEKGLMPLLKRPQKGRLRVATSMGRKLDPTDRALMVTAIAAGVAIGIAGIGIEITKLRANQPPKP